MNTKKRIGILTSGGDCPGLNPVIRTVVSHATLTYGWEVLGIPYATQGLQEGKAIPLTMHSLDLCGIDPLLYMGGTFLGTINKGDTLNNAEAILAGYKTLGLDALIAIGGDGSLAILHTLALRGGWELIGIPKTIDNDVAVTERAIGFDTAVNTIIDALNRLSFTAASHDRVMVVEVMGRKAGHLALHAGIAGGADVILIPEIPYSITGVCQHLRELRERWHRKSAIVLVAEGIEPVGLGFNPDGTPIAQPPRHGMGQYIADHILEADPHLDVRVSVLGHIQRGGMPLALDRLMAAAFGKTAVDLVAEGKTDQMVTWQGSRVVPVPMAEVLAQSPRSVNPNSYLVQTAEALGIYIGDRSSAPSVKIPALV
jgi:6-phosphofructokinase 1